MVHRLLLFGVHVLTILNKVVFSRSAPIVPANETKNIMKPTATIRAPGSVAVLVNSVYSFFCVTE